MSLKGFIAGLFGRGNPMLSSELQRVLNRLWGDERPFLSDRGLAVAQELERRYDLDLPDEFRAYLIEGPPRVDWMHGSGIIWWAPGRIKSLKDECGTETPEDQINPEIEVEEDHYLVFADYLDWCGYAYAICCSAGPNRGKVAMVGTSPDRFVAGSFRSFVLLAVEDSDRLHSPVGDKYSDLV